MNTPVDIVCEDPRWDALALPDLANAAAVHTLSHLGLAVEAHEICLLACDDARIAELNAQFRDRPRPTNVLSWPSLDLGADEDGEPPVIENAPAELGDIAIAWDTCAREAVAGNIDMRDHVFHLLVHGILHLLGYDHIRDKDAALMEASEIAILTKVGIANPYADQRGATDG